MLRGDPITDWVVIVQLHAAAWTLSAMHQPTAWYARPNQALV